MADKKKALVKEGFLRSFGRTASRMSVAEQAQLDEILKAFALNPTQMNNCFAQKGPLTVELGVGKGEQILSRASATPDERFIACEVFKNGLRFLTREATKQNLRNLKIYPHDARVLLAELPEQSVDHLLILYPDPWPKKRHNRRRLVNKALLADASRVLKPEGELLLVTDIVDYALWMLREVYTHEAFFPVATNPQEWATPPQGWVPTGYERKAKKEGRSPFYLRLKHKQQIETQNHNKGETTAKE